MSATTGGRMDRQRWAHDLQRARLAAGYRARKDLAAAAGVAKDTIDELEQGKRLPRQDTLAALRAVLPTLPVPLDVSPDGAGGLTVHLPMNPTERALMLAELLKQTLLERSSD